MAKRRAGPSSSSEAQAPPSSSSKRRITSGKRSGWPWWLYIVGGLCLLVCLGRVFDSALQSKESKDTGSGGKKSKKGGKSSGGKRDSTMGFLELALRLQQLTEVTSGLVGVDSELDPKDLDTITNELADIEKEISSMEEAEEGSTVARDLRSMVSVIRGTMVQVTSKLTDEQVEKLGNSYTYANPRYWDEYYKKTTEEERFDWYGSWDSPLDGTTFQPYGVGKAITANTVGDLVKPYLKTEDKILMFGCGNSDMSEKMYHKGYENIMNIDISESLIEGLRARLAASMPRMQWKYENASGLSFEAEKFDVTIDKGTLDAIEQNLPLLQAAVKEAHRTLRPGGLFISITFQPDTIRVDKQLRDYAPWGECHSHPFTKETAGGKTASGYHVHACQRT